MVMDDLTVILEVQRHRILYDPGNPFYKDNFRKEQAWSEVAAVLRADPADVKSRWRMLRDSYVKHLKKASSSNGPPGGAQRDWKFANSMIFIQPFVQNRAPKRCLRSSDLDRDRPAPAPSLDLAQASAPHPATCSSSPLPLWMAPLEEERQYRPAVTDNDRDEMYHFALSTVPQLLRLGKRYRRRAKLEILQTLDRLEEEEEVQAAAQRYFHQPVPELPRTEAPVTGGHEDPLLLQSQDNPLLQELRNNEPRFKEYLGLSTAQFNVLLRRVGNSITLMDTNYRRPIPAAVRLAVCLRYLVSGEPLKLVADSFGVAMSSVCKILTQVSQALWDCLRGEVLPEPCLADWSTEAEEFERCWGFPLCCGVLGGRCVELKPPPGSASQQEGGETSLVLLAVVDAQGRFKLVEVGGFGRASDAEAMAGSAFCQSLRENKVPLPPDRLLPGTERPQPHVFVAEKAFSLRRNVMRTFPGEILSPLKRTFNCRVSRALQPARDAFNTLASQWGLYHRPVEVRPELVEQCVRVTCALHNFIQNFTRTLEEPRSEGQGSEEQEQALEGDLERAMEVALEGTVFPEENGWGMGVEAGGEGCAKRDRAGVTSEVEGAALDVAPGGTGRCRGHMLRSLERPVGHKPTREAMCVREVFAAYFSAEGAKT